MIEGLIEVKMIANGLGDNERDDDSSFDSSVKTSCVQNLEKKGCMLVKDEKEMNWKQLIGRDMCCDNMSDEPWSGGKDTLPKFHFKGWAKTLSDHT